MTPFDLRKTPKAVGFCDQIRLTDVRDAYEASVSAWANGPDAYYRRLGDALVSAAAAARDLHGAAVLDVGAGTGAVSAAAFAAGAFSVVAVDLAFGMLRYDAGDRPAGAVADTLALPFMGASFDVVAAGCVLNHLPRPDHALREMARVTGPGGCVLASTFGTTEAHPVKEQVDRALATFGFRNPAWHDAMKRDIEPRTATPDGLLAAATAAGISVARVDTLVIDSGLRTAEDFVHWRLGMASTAPFFAGLDDRSRRGAFDAAVEAVGMSPPPFAPTLLVLVATVVTPAPRPATQ
ncbi:MAG: class SAM-dependent methyltransferase [Actinomycetia bacterium]|nr:class SAM-dependent methyltransferase [Actinomycetes bacterium]